MGNFSKPPLEVLLANLANGYVGLHIEQGVPVLDRDLNLLNDLLSATVRNVIARYIGNGLAAGDQGFAIESIKTDNDFRIRAGTEGPGVCLVDGIEVTINESINYSAQEGIPELTTPQKDGNRIDRVYLDVWLEELGEDNDEYVDLNNSADVGMRTSVRLKPTWRVRVAEGQSVPDSLPGHSHYPLARLTRSPGDAMIRETMITDLRQLGLTLADVEQRLNQMKPSFDADTPFEPQQGPVGRTVRILGRNFNIGSVEVKFGNLVVSAESVETISAEEIRAKAPEGASGEIPIGVATAAGSVVSEFNFTVTEKPEFDVQRGEFDPKEGRSSREVTLFGYHFDGPVKVLFGTQSAEVLSTTANEIHLKVPEILVGEVHINVIFTDGYQITSEDTFSVIGIGPPQFEREPGEFYPKEGQPGAFVTLSGHNFDGPELRVLFGTKPAEISNASANKIEVTVPSLINKPSRVRISVSTVLGSTESIAEFSYYFGGS